MVVCLTPSTNHRPRRMKCQVRLLIGATYCAILDQFNRLCAWCDKRLPDTRYTSYHNNDHQ